MNRSMMIELLRDAWHEVTESGKEKLFYEALRRLDDVQLAALLQSAADEGRPEND